MDVWKYEIISRIAQDISLVHGNGFCSSVGRLLSRDPGSQVQFSAGGFGVVFFATGPSSILKHISFFKLFNLPFKKSTL